jgi:prepilin-type N-terminal cleavage/methylation domain-containing protein
MKRTLNKTGVTLVEILVVVVIIAILVTMVIGIALRIDTQGKEQLAESTIALLTAALGEFRDFGYAYNPPYTDLKFPLDCNNFSDTDFETTLETALGLGSGGVAVSGGTHYDEYSGSEAMYFFLNRVPESRKILDKIDRKFVTNLGLDGNPMIITIDPGPNEKAYPLFRVIDPWDKPLRYSYYDNTNESPTSEPAMSSPMVFPLITSAGPDGDFNTVIDNITNK